MFLNLKCNYKFEKNFWIFLYSLSKKKNIWRSLRNFLSNWINFQLSWKNNLIRISSSFFCCVSKYIYFTSSKKSITFSVDFYDNRRKILKCCKKKLGKYAKLKSLEKKTYHENFSFGFLYFSFHHNMEEKKILQTYVWLSYK